MYFQIVIETFMFYLSLINNFNKIKILALLIIKIIILLSRICNYYKYQTI